MEYDIGLRNCVELNYLNMEWCHERSEFCYFNYDSSEASVIILVISRAKRVGLLP